MRLEYLTLAVGNAKSHPVSAGSRQETAIAFLTDLEEKLEVAQVQLEIFNQLARHFNDQDERGERVRLLSKGLMTITEVRGLPLSLAQRSEIVVRLAISRVCCAIRPTQGPVAHSSCVRAPGRECCAANMERAHRKGCSIPRDTALRVLTFFLDSYQRRRV